MSFLILVPPFLWLSTDHLGLNCLGQCFIRKHLIKADEFQLLYLYNQQDSFTYAYYLCVSKKNL